MNQTNKEKAKDALNGAKEKAKAALSEIKTNFKADEGTEGVKKYKSMFANLWKSGTTGKATLVAASIVVLLFFKSIFFGGSSDVGEGFEDSKSADVDTLVMKGLYMRQSGDEALKACKKIVSSSKNLVVVDFRNGIEREKDEATKAAEKKEYEKNIAQSKEDAESFFQWYDYSGRGFDLKRPNFEKSGDGVGPVKLRRNDERCLISRTDHVGASVFTLAAHFNYQVEWMLPVNPAVKSDEPPKPFIGKCNPKDFVGDASYFIQNVVREELLVKSLDMVKIGDGARVWFRLTLCDEKGNPVEKKKLFSKFLQSKRCSSPKSGAREQEVAAYKKKLAEAKNEFLSYLNWVEFDGDAFALKSINGVPDFASRGKRLQISREEMQSFAKLGNLQVEWMVPTRTGGVKCETGILSVPKKSEEEVQHFMYTTMANINKESLLYGKIKEKGLEMARMDSPGAWFRLASKDAKGGAVTKEDVAKNWLAARGYYPPSDKMIIAKKNLIEIAIREDGKREDELKGICFVWINDEGKVKDIFFNEKGMARIFNAGDLSSEEFAQALVKNYSDIPSMDVDVTSDFESDDGTLAMKTYTWTYKDPRGFRVKILDRAFYNGGGQRIHLREDAQLQIALSLNKKEEKWFDFQAIKPESARKFD